MYLEFVNIVYRLGFAVACCGSCLVMSSVCFWGKWQRGMRVNGERVDV